MRLRDSENFELVATAALYSLFRSHKDRDALELAYRHILDNSSKQAKEASIKGGVPHTTSILSLLEHAIRDGR